MLTNNYYLLWWKEKYIDHVSSLTFCCLEKCAKNRNLLMLLKQMLKNSSIATGQIVRTLGWDDDV